MKPLDYCTMYVFVRQDIPLAQQLVQSNHATFGITRWHVTEDGTPNLIVVGVPDIAALNRVLAKLKRLQLAHFAWSEPDFDIGFTAIATGPLSEAEKLPLANYRLWRYSPQPLTAIVSDDAASPLGGEPCRLSSEKEHSVFNRGVTGSIPVVGSNSVNCS